MSLIDVGKETNKTIVHLNNPHISSRPFQGCIKFKLGQRKKARPSVVSEANSTNDISQLFFFSRLKNKVVKLIIPPLSLSLSLSLSYFFPGQVTNTILSPSPRLPHKYFRANFLPTRTHRSSKRKKSIRKTSLSRATN